MAKWRNMTLIVIIEEQYNYNNRIECRHCSVKGGAFFDLFTNELIRGIFVAKQRR